MRITVKNTGSFKRTERWLNNLRSNDPIVRTLRRFGEKGVTALSNATPVDTGEAASSWYYEVKKVSNGYNLIWANSKMAGTVPLVVLLQYGHGTTGGTWVQGRDFINPALLPIVNSLSEELWKEVLNG